MTKTTKVPILIAIIIYINYFITLLGITLLKFSFFRFIKRLWNIIAIQFCIWEAKSLHKLTNKQYYVLKVYGKISVMSTTQINYNRRKRLINKSLDYYRLQELCIFKTK
ncbi:MAG: hypothetical protein NTZ33_13925 [Bacteroidetes bacterium]|nr:hypothetical protein [Bacteroidota bacterium]